MTVKTKRKTMLLQNLYSTQNHLKYFRVGALKLAEEESSNLYLTKEVNMADPLALMKKAEMFIRKFELNL